MRYRLLRRLALVVALLAPWVGVGQVAEPRTAVEAQIYAEVLNTIFPGNGDPRYVIVVSSDSISMEPGYKMFMPSGFSGERLEEDIEWRLPDAKPQTIKNFVNNSTVPHKVHVAPGALGSRLAVRLAPQADIDAALAGDNALRWERFGHHYPGATHLIQLSPIGFDPAGHEAIVYVHRTCAGLCGSGHLILLERTKDSHWSVRQTNQFWIS